MDADEAIAKEVLRVVEPGAAEAAHRAARDVADKRDDAIRALELELQAARYAADRAWKQYDGTDPENRLVAAELERRWNAALRKSTDIESRLDQERTHRDAAAPATVEALSNLADDFTEVWDNPSTDVRLQKRLLRAVKPILRTFWRNFAGPDWEPLIESGHRDLAVNRWPGPVG